VRQVGHAEDDVVLVPPDVGKQFAVPGLDELDEPRRRRDALRRASMRRIQFNSDDGDRSCASTLMA
jgi:hypothetical protein